ncbi:MAG: phosphopantothenoylcysteine decarboxylase [Actinobacteria bacterium BACL15 MAG-120619-bin91]|jgi:phosphopantothenoylcysteine decarboxylase / phosphopantothenate---cysteine ligase|uniref:Coenzyme A biosynthesis bifunctional protein CoaBC n=2 Tax=ac1 cluster TaxID=1655545 RepID=A0A0R2PEZ8_9ACTN|nr:MAG: phosphopantothenoylcysteine decarboxylase [Actinobacteria bacterium BACL15 MAG-120619-bin91]
MRLQGREVILGVGGGIAAYKSCELLRRLQDRGYVITVVPTPSSLNFVGAATWEALSGRPVTTQVWESVHTVPHIALAERANFFLIAPATADLIARLAMGRADDLLTNLVLASDVPKMIVPAMHPSMWLDPATVANVATLKNRGFIVMEPEVGRLTGDDIGPGRFPETTAIISTFDGMTGHKQDLAGKKVLITAGGTREAIDPVRFIGNRSSGKQGIALAQAARDRGAQVGLIAANCDVSHLKGVELFPVETTAQMQAALQKQFDSCDILIMAAAVADARPSEVASDKIKKVALSSIDLEENPDLLAEISARKSKQILIGFAAETKDHLQEARRKLEAKGLDVIYVNDVSGGAIFGQDTTMGTILIRNEADIAVKEVSKDALSNTLLDQAIRQLG